MGRARSADGDRHRPPTTIESGRRSCLTPALRVGTVALSVFWTPPSTMWPPEWAVRRAAIESASDTSAPPAQGTQSLERALALLDAIAQEPTRAMGLAGRLDIPRPTVIRMLGVLERHRYVTRGPDDAYYLGTRPLELTEQWHGRSGSRDWSLRRWTTSLSASERRPSPVYGTAPRESLHCGQREHPRSPIWLVARGADCTLRWCLQQDDLGLRAKPRPR